MTREQALAVWAILAATTSGRELTEAELDVRAGLIIDLEFGPARDAAERLARTATWLPSVAAFREAVIRPAIPPAGDAWGEVCQVVHRLGWPTPPTAADFSDPLILRAVQAMGAWADFCGGDETVNRAHFLKIYPALAEQARVEAIAGPAPVAAIAAAEAARGLDMRLDRELGEAP